jgi:cellulose synthase/poly-beta-1,6-N-acetylglucosamine synthase-like glycosyltransferase
MIWLLVAWWALAALVALLNWLFLPRLSSEETQDPLPTLTVVIPARNEERGLGPAVEAHCAQDYPGLQVVVVDDGSEDRTPEILRDLQARYPNLTVVQGTPPEEGWLGKPNAQRQGLGAATGDYVLFVDADVVYAPGVHRRAVGEVLRRDLDMLLLLSTLEGRWPERVVLSFLDTFSFYVSPTILANVPSLKWAAFGAGSGNLVRREAFEAAGGIGKIRAEVVDDVAMGRMMKALRGRFRVVFARGDIRVRMYEGFRAAVEGFTKNYYAAFGFSPWFAVPAVGLYVVLHVLPPAALAAALLLPGARALLLPAALACGAEAALNAWGCSWSGQGWWIGLMAPIRALVWGYILVRSMGRYYRRGVVWRGRSYTQRT